MLGILVGLEAEKKIIRPFQKKALIASSGATREGAIRGVKRLIAAGATKLLSFGCAAGLAPEIGAGTIIIPEYVLVDDQPYPVDPALSSHFGAKLPRIFRGGLLHSDEIVTSAVFKERLHRESTCSSVDMESGFIAQTGLPFAVLRVICDNAHRDLPPLVATVLSEGRIAPGKLVVSLVSQPAQLPGLLELGRDAAMARKEMRRFLKRVL